MQVRNILKIVVSALCLVAVSALTLYVVLGWSSIPEQVPINYDARGQIAGTDGKGSLIGLLVFIWFMQIFETYMIFRPLSKGGAVAATHFGLRGGGLRFNLGVNAAKKNPVAANNAIIDMMLVLMPVITVGFSRLVVCAVRVQPVGILFLPLFISGVILPILITVIRLVRISL
ncbi:MAG: hypothetical protein IJQ12_10070 [Lachnospiraceae bacterium]|nr:hypothetical protein [Lachnospiraceae bacterium]